MTTRACANPRHLARALHFEALELESFEPPGP